MSNPLKHYHTIHSAATLLSLTPETVSFYCRSGRLTGEKFGGVWHVHRREVYRYLKAVAKKPKALLSTYRQADTV